MSPRSLLTVAYTGRPELECCRRRLRTYPVAVVGFGGPVDLGVSAAGSRIFTPDEIRQARYGIVNLHLAPLPEYRGRFSAAHALANGDREYGVTLHYIDESIDTGPIIDEHRFPIDPGETVESLRRKARNRGAELFDDALPLLIHAALKGRKVDATPQDETRARYYDRHSLPA